MIQEDGALIVSRPLYFCREANMALFDQILGAINNPNQQANTDQLSSILGMVQQAANNQGVDPSANQAMLSMVGGYVRSALQQKQAEGGRGQVEAIVNQFAGANPNMAIQALFPPQQQQQIAEAISQRTGLPAGTIQAMLPVAVASVMNLLQSGATNQNAQGSNTQGSNNILSAFIDSDRDGDVDVGDAMAIASRFLNQSR
jgi:hypothetical protein